MIIYINYFFWFCVCVFFLVCFSCSIVLCFLFCFSYLFEWDCFLFVWTVFCFFWGSDFLFELLDCLFCRFVVEFLILFVCFDLFETIATFRSGPVRSIPGLFNDTNQLQYANKPPCEDVSRSKSFYQQNILRRENGETTFNWRT